MQQKLEGEGVHANSRTCLLTNTSETGFEFPKRSKYWILDMSKRAVLFKSFGGILPDRKFYFIFVVTN